MTWLKTFIAENPNPPNNFPNLLKGGTSSLRDKKGTPGISPLTKGNLRVFDLTGRELRFMTGSRDESDAFKLPKASHPVFFLGTQSK